MQSLYIDFLKWYSLITHYIFKISHSIFDYKSSVDLNTTEAVLVCRTNCALTGAYGKCMVWRTALGLQHKSKRSSIKTALLCICLCRSCQSMTSLFSNTMSPAKDGNSSMPRRSSNLGKPPLRALYDLLIAPMEGVSDHYMVQ